MTETIKEIFKGDKSCLDTKENTQAKVAYDFHCSDTSCIEKLVKEICNFHVLHFLNFKLYHRQNLIRNNLFSKYKNIITSYHFSQGELISKLLFFFFNLYAWFLLFMSFFIILFLFNLKNWNYSSTRHYIKLFSCNCNLLHDKFTHNIYVCVQFIIFIHVHSERLIYIYILYMVKLPAIELHPIIIEDNRTNNLLHTYPTEGERSIQKRIRKHSNNMIIIIKINYLNENKFNSQE